MEIVGQQRTLVIYQDKTGREPFTKWLEDLKDRETRVKIKNRLRRIEIGNIGDCRSVGEGVHELKFNFGKGYRVYFGEVDKIIILLLCGGDKSSQAKDIERAKRYWHDFKGS